MGVKTKSNKFVHATELKPIHFDLQKDVRNRLKYEIDFIIKDNRYLAEYTLKKENSHLLSHYKHGNNIHLHEEQ